MLPTPLPERVNPETSPGPDLPSPELGDRVSIVLLTYNCADRIDDVLDHLLDLGIPVIAVDNGSADGTADVLRSRPGLIIVALPENIGAAARNVGVAQADTPYVACCDDDGWYERDGLALASELLDRHPSLAVVNGRILVGPEERLDPISAEMADSPLPDRDGLPGRVLLGFMAGAVVVRCSAYLSAGGYGRRFFIGGEEETLSYSLAKAGWQLRYVPEVVVYHRPSRANVDQLRAFGLRNTLWNAWLHRPWRSALRWTIFTLADRPKNRDWLRGAAMALAGLGWVIRERRPMSSGLDADLQVLDRRRFADRRPVVNRREGAAPVGRRSEG